MKRNEVFEIVSCLILIVCILFGYRLKDFQTILLLFVSIGIFSVLTYFNGREGMDMEGYALIKCECMLLCLLMMISWVASIDLSVFMILIFGMTLFTTTNEIRKHQG